MRCKIGLNNESFRQEWIKNTLKQVPSGLHLLDAGAGELANKKYCQHLEYISQDFCQYDGKGDAQALQTGEWDTSKIDIVSDITSIPVENESFDVVLCTEVFEHLPDPVSALNELVRVLKKDGLLILTAPFCSLTHFAPYHFSSGFNKYFYQHHLGALNCEIKELTENGNFFEYLAQEIHRIPTIADKYSHSKFSFFDRLAQKILLKALNRFSKKDFGSKELLCYGYHVVAIKK
ncbi:MAG: class I SAM-dependent methyltransferase [Sulfurimonadaceae bacterium]